MEEMRTGTAQREPEPSGGVTSLLGGVFVDPKATFESVAARTSVPHPTDPSKTRDNTMWWIPLLILIVVSVVTVALVVVPYVAGPAAEEGIRQSIMEGGGTEADVQRLVEQSAPFIMPFSILGGVLQSVAMLFIVAGILHLLMKLMGGKASFRGARAVTAYSMLITALGSAIKVPFMMAKESLFVETGPVIFFQNLEPSDRLYGFLFTGFDVFTLWWLAVLGIGAAVVYRTSKAKGFTAAVIIWLLYSLVGMFQQGGG
ncbi:MAG: hypothetical protein GF400_07815 [Candidatus Eisenbacteria bacterium]|nr:hypothetical protein [Candidatus Eisenbacteria bacterium]